MLSPRLNYQLFGPRCMEKLDLQSGSMSSLPALSAAKSVHFSTTPLFPTFRVRQHLNSVHLLEWQLTWGTQVLALLALRRLVSNSSRRNNGRTCHLRSRDLISSISSNCLMNDTLDKKSKSLCIPIKATDMYSRMPIRHHSREPLTVS